jgi:hypothetical protein
MSSKPIKFEYYKDDIWMVTYDLGDGVHKTVYEERHQSLWDQTVLLTRDKWIFEQELMFFDDDEEREERLKAAYRPVHMTA